jgi:hypothetical protein
MIFLVTRVVSVFCAVEFQIKSCDTDGDGKLTFSEVIAAMKN